VSFGVTLPYCNHLNGDDESAEPAPNHGDAITMTVWLDVTTSLTWQGPPTGVVRVEMECARFFLARAKKEEGIRFCRYLHDRQGYAEVDPVLLASVLEAFSRGTEGTAVRRAGGMKVRLGRYLAQWPEVWRARVSALGRLAGAIARNLRGALQALAPGELPVIFGQGDVYVSLGCDWDDKDLRVLERFKAQHGLRVMLCCHDIIPVVRPDLTLPRITQMFTAYLDLLIRVADHVLCVSAHTQRDFLGYLETRQQGPRATSVIRHGSQPSAASLGEIAPEVSRILEQPFILFVSTLEPRKNHRVLYQAYLRLIETGQQPLPLLVWVGKPGWGVDELLTQLSRDTRIQPYVRLLHRVTDTDLNRLYEQALFTVYPSRYEGWGLPVAESLAHGKFCLVSNAASLPEVGGDLVEYLDPVDAAAWAERLAWYFSHPEHLAARVDRIRRAYRPTPWAETARQVLQTARNLEAVA